MKFRHLIWLAALAAQADGIPDMPSAYRAVPADVIAAARAATSERFPDADSVMVGDSLSDMQFAVNAGIIPVHVGAKHPGEYEEIQKITPLHYRNLLDFAKNYPFDANQF